MTNIKSIAIAGITYKIELKKHIPGDKHENVYGLCEPDKRVITIKSGLDPLTYRLTLAHEIFHAVMYHSGHAAWLSLKQEESLASVIEHMYYPLIKRLIKKDVL